MCQLHHSPLVYLWVGVNFEAGVTFGLVIIYGDQVVQGTFCGLMLYLEYSVVGVPIEVGNSFVDRVVMSNPIEHAGLRGIADPPSDSL